MFRCVDVCSGSSCGWMSARVGGCLQPDSLETNRLGLRVGLPFHGCIRVEIQDRTHIQVEYSDCIQDSLTELSLLHDYFIVFIFV